MLVYNDVYNSKKLNSIFSNNKKDISQLNAFEVMEKMRICDFVLNFESASKYLDYLPQFLQIKIDTESNNYFLKKKYYYGDEKENASNEYLNMLQSELDGIGYYITEKFDFEIYFSYQRESSTIRYYKIPVNVQKDFFLKLFFLNIFQGLLSLKIEFPKDYARRFIFEPENLDNISYSEHDKLMKIKEILSNLIEKSNWYEYDLILSMAQSKGRTSKKDDVYKYLGTLGYLIEPKENKEILRALISNIDNLLLKKSIFSYEPMRELSSGQKQLLNLFSRFFWAKNEILTNEKGDYGIFGKNIIIFIDEGEVALHPEWQRLFFNKVTNFLSELFDGRTIQLFITTHSPFVLSDIPKDNIIFLDRDDSGNCKVSRIDKENTFAANIYSLFLDSFFMESTIGSFAQEKMKWVLEILKSHGSDYPLNLINEIKYTIDSIGEPLIKEQMTSLYTNKFGDMDELNSLRRRIRELEEELKNRRNDNTEN